MNKLLRACLILSIGMFIPIIGSYIGYEYSLLIGLITVLGLSIIFMI